MGDEDLAPKCIAADSRADSVLGFWERLRESPSEVAARIESAEMSGAESNAVNCFGGRVASGVISDALDEAAVESGGIPKLSTSS